MNTTQMWADRLRLHYHEAGEDAEVVTGMVAGAARYGIELSEADAWRQLRAETEAARARQAAADREVEP